MARHILLVLLAFSSCVGAQTREFSIDSIQVEGNRILTAAGIASASGLKVGAPGSSKLFDDARDRLLATGYLENVSYRFKPAGKGSGYQVTFEVQEMQPLYSLRMEALPMTAAEITAWLKGKDPLFTGRIPGTQQALDRTAHEIEQYLVSKNHTAKVAGKVVSVSPERFEALFTPAEGLPNVALVSFEGNKVVSTSTLQNAMAAVAFGQPYTESNFRILLDNTVKPLYEKDGYMRVSFPRLATTPSATVKGIDVRVAINEGEQFKMGSVAVRGPMADESKHILLVAKIPKMGIVDFDQLSAAAARVRDSLRHEGYLDAECATDRDINDEKKIVDVFLVPQGGPQYTFGKLDVKGLGLDGVAAIQKMWTVKPGEPFPGEYPDYFAKRIKEEGLFDNLGDTKAEQEINAETHVVNVTLNFKYESEQRKKKPLPGQDPLQVPTDHFAKPLFLPNLRTLLWRERQASLRP